MPGVIDVDAVCVGSHVAAAAVLRCEFIMSPLV